MSQSLEELALFKSLPPGVLEKYALQIIDRLGDEFIRVYHTKLSKKLNDRIGGYTLMLEYIKDKAVDRMLVSMNAQYDEVVVLLFRLIDKSDDRWSALNWSYLGLLGGENQLYVDKYYELEHEENNSISKDDKLFRDALDVLRTAYSEDTLVDNICERSARGDVRCPSIYCKDGTISIRLTVSKAADRCELSAGRGSIISIIDIDEIFNFVETL